MKEKMNKVMKIIKRHWKKSILYFLLCLQLCIFSCGKSVKVTSADIPKENKLSCVAEFVTFPYEELKEESAIIAKVEVLDELSSENSLTDYDEGYGLMIRFCAVRSVRVLEVYKNDRELAVGDELQVQEPCAIYKLDGEYYQDTMDDTPPLQKGDTYILFLDDGTENMSGKPSIISCQNGMVELNKTISDDGFFDVSVKAIVEYESDLPEEEKESILQAKEIYEMNPSESEKKVDIQLETGKGEVDISLGMKEEEEGVIGISIE